MTDSPPNGYLSQSFVEHTVNERVLHFYPIRLYETFRLRTVAKPLVRALTQLFGGGSDKSTQSHYEYDPKDTRPVKDQMPLVSDTTIMAPSVELARYRDEERAKAAELIADTLLTESNADILVRLFMDSLREVYEAPIKQDQVETVRKSLDAVSFGEMLVGLGKANQKALGPFAKQVGLKVGVALGSEAPQEPTTASAAG